MWKGLPTAHSGTFPEASHHPNQICFISKTNTCSNSVNHLFLISFNVLFSGLILFYYEYFHNLAGCVFLWESNLLPCL